MPKRRSDHVIWDNSVEGVATPPQLYPAMRLRCRHCGNVYDLAVPVSLRVAAAAMKAYGADHRGCRKRTDAAAAGSVRKDEENIRARGDVTAEPPHHADAPRASPNDE